MKQADQHPAMSEDALVEVLSGSLYPGAQRNSVVMVLAYCKAAQLDPMLKPVHIVPIWSKSAGKMVDTVMPGVGLYRIQAARTGQYAGISEPEYGPAVTMNLGGVEVTFPEWCRITVRRQMTGGHVAEFTASERWLENYATAKKDTLAPNAMWLKRAYAQLAKCAEAQALRKAFPEVGSAPTADEMEGKVFEDGPREVNTQRQPDPHPEPTALDDYPDEKLQENLPKWRAAVEAGRSSPDHLIATVSSKYTLSEQQIEQIKNLAPIEGVSE
ncbi:phage recombination protein Bet [Pseudomonas fulva]|nr:MULTISPECIES: phage recombination protein Bet [Pseudomonas]MCY4124403.1 phage recombination protein Bet [Pseudomonas sp.]MBN6789894.1 phage recombination protein Bet [Pseudomonas fulva]MBN6794864.1 phage recombination protein Bet [Pseudomonas fulva]MBN6855317.1 phage recombination protein Bet [Pseudomonas fulva]MBN6872486.1 phage recombination protein Bet [Pseudomonas fulva]